MLQVETVRSQEIIIAFSGCQMPPTPSKVIRVNPESVKIFAPQCSMKPYDAGVLKRSVSMMHTALSTEFIFGKFQNMNKQDGTMSRPVGINQLSGRSCRMAPSCSNDLAIIC